MSRRALLLVLVLSACTSEPEVEAPVAGSIEACRNAADVDACLIDALDGPTDSDQIAVLVAAHDRQGNEVRAAELRRRYIARFADARAQDYQQQLDEALGDAEEIPAPSDDEGATGPTSNPLMDCAGEANYNSCIVRNLRRPSSLREYEALINAYRETGQRARACALMRQVIERYPSSPAARRFGSVVQRQCN